MRTICQRDLYFLPIVSDNKFILVLNFTSGHLFIAQYRFYVSSLWHGKKGNLAFLNLIQCIGFIDCVEFSFKLFKISPIESKVCLKASKAAMVVRQGQLCIVECIKYHSFE